jgi:UDP-N-acetylmuramoyl-tripeptide--D-alanyl-D-alanine ligase
VLNVGSAHLGEFGDIAVTARSKGELVEALPAAAAGGVAVLNADDALVTAMAGRTKARVLWVGEHQSADVRADNVRIDERGRARFDLLFDGRRAPVTLRVFGEHQVANALSAAGVGIACGLGLGEIAAALSEAVIASPWRMQVVETADGTVVVNDSYNANPESMRAAFKALVSMSRGRRSVALLGHMAELGPSSRTEHDALGRLAVRLDISQLVAVGEQAKPVAHGAALEGSWNGESEWSSDVAALIERLPSLIRPGDVVLVKGSRSAGMERVADAVIAHAGGAVGERGQAS